MRIWAGALLASLATISPALAAGAPAAPSSAAPPAPMRTLVYAFMYNVKQTGEVTNDPGSTGSRTYSGNLNDSGTITVGVMREASDRGLVVVVSEKAKDSRSADPAECAIYGNTNVLCEPGKTVNSEEYAILRFLASNFIDVNQVDEHFRWQVDMGNDKSSFKATYSIVNIDTGVLSIDETRNVTQRGTGVTTYDIQTKLKYNAARLLPLDIQEYAIERQQGGIQATSTATTQTTLSLVSDSLPKS